MGKSSYTPVVIILMINSFYFALMAVTDNSMYKLCIEDEENFFIENPDMNIWGIIDVKECSQFKDFRDVSLVIAMPLMLIAGTKQLHNKWNNEKTEMLKEYNPTKPLMFYVFMIIIAMVIFSLSVYLLLTIETENWLLLGGIFVLPFVSSGIISSSERRYWTLKEKGGKYN